MKSKRVKQVIFSEILLIIGLINIDKNFLLAFISIVIHEFTHILLAKRKGSKFNNLRFHIYGANVELVDFNELTNKDKLIVYISGAVSNLILMIIFGVISIHTNQQIFDTIARLNLGLAILNLLPAYPLDGARVLEIILSRKITFKKAQKIISIISYIIATIFIFISISTIIFLRKFNISVMIVGIIIIYITKTEVKSTMYILMGNMFKKRKSLIKHGYIENRTISVYYKQELIKLMIILDKDKFNIFYVLNDELKVVYILKEDELVEALKVYGNILIEDYVNIKKGSS